MNCEKIENLLTRSFDLLKRARARSNENRAQPYSTHYRSRSHIDNETKPRENASAISSNNGNSASQKHNESTIQQNMASYSSNITLGSRINNQTKTQDTHSSNVFDQNDFLQKLEKKRKATANLRASIRRQEEIILQKILTNLK